MENIRVGNLHIPFESDGTSVDVSHFNSNKFVRELLTFPYLLPLPFLLYYGTYPTYPESAKGMMLIIIGRINIPLNLKLSA